MNDSQQHMATVARSDEELDLYPSRTGAAARLWRRRDPVVRGRRPSAIDPLRWAQYETDGFLTLEGFLGEPKIASLAEAVQRLRRELSDSQRPEVIREPGTGAIRSIFAPHRLDEVIDRMARNPVILAIVEAVLGGPAYIHQARINYKPAFVGKAFYWHSDFETWHVEDGMPEMRALSMSISLTENNLHNSPLMMVPRSHRTFVACPGLTPHKHYEQSLVNQEYGVPTDEQLAMLVEAGGIVAAPGTAGSLTMFDCNTMHGSGSNITPWPRTNLFIVYNSVENQLGPPCGGLSPRPEYIAAREQTAPIRCLD